MLEFGVFETAAQEVDQVIIFLVQKPGRAHAPVVLATGFGGGVPALDDLGAIGALW